MSFSTMLKRIREERRLSQKDIADYLGLTRQAVASYELAKREPDYDVLRKLADYFGVSVDYLLGRSNCKDLNALTVGSNIDIIRGNLTYKELSEDIGRKIGTVIFPELLELYAKGERMPFSGTIKILAKYANVHETFFHSHNTIESYMRERSIYQMELENNKTTEEVDISLDSLDFMDNALKKWISQEKNIDYIMLAKEIQESGLPPGALRPLLGSIKRSKDLSSF